jgi:hypothetical protein
MESAAPKQKKMEKEECIYSSWYTIFQSCGFFFLHLEVTFHSHETN